MKETDHFFIVGVDRSGTTLLSLMLDSHSRIAIPYESHFFVDYYKKRDSLGDLKEESNRISLVNNILNEPYVVRWDQQVTIEEINLERCNSLEETINQIYLAYARKFNKDIWGDKTPSYISDIHILNEMFPHSKFIHIIRDGRDVALSIIKQWWGPDDFITAIKYWEKNVRCARKMLRMLPHERYIELKFEDLVSTPERELRRITNFLGVKFESGMVGNYKHRALHKVGDRVYKYHKNLTGQLSLSQTFKWMKLLSPVDQAIAFEIAGLCLLELGYPLGVKNHPLKIFGKCYHRLKESYTWRSKKIKNMFKNEKLAE